MSIENNLMELLREAAAERDALAAELTQARELLQAAVDLATRQVGLPVG